MSSFVIQERANNNSSTDVTSKVLKSFPRDREFSESLYEPAYFTDICTESFAKSKTSSFLNISDHNSSVSSPKAQQCSDDASSCTRYNNDENDDIIIIKEVHMSQSKKQNHCANMCQNKKNSDSSSKFQFPQKSTAVSAIKVSEVDPPFSSATSMKGDERKPNDMPISSKGFHTETVPFLDSTSCRIKVKSPSNSSAGLTKNYSDNKMNGHLNQSLEDRDLYPGDSNDVQLSESNKSAFTNSSKPSTDLSRDESSIQILGSKSKIKQHSDAPKNIDVIDISDSDDDNESAKKPVVVHCSAFCHRRNGDERIMPQLIPLCPEVEFQGDSNNNKILSSPPPDIEIIEVPSSPEMPRLIPFTSETEEPPKIVDTDSAVKRFLSKSSNQLSSNLQPKVVLRKLSFNSCGLHKTQLDNRQKSYCIQRSDVDFSTCEPDVDIIDGLNFYSFSSKTDMESYCEDHSDSILFQVDDDDDLESNESLDKDTSTIVPTKTNDITQIKGWRTKHFAPEKQIPFYHDPCEDNDGFSKDYEEKVDISEIMSVDDSSKTFEETCQQSLTASCESCTAPSDIGEDGCSTACKLTEEMVNETAVHKSFVKASLEKNGKSSLQNISEALVQELCKEPSLEESLEMSIEESCVASKFNNMSLEKTDSDDGGRISSEVIPDASSSLKHTKKNLSAFVSVNLDSFLETGSYLNVSLLQEVNPNITPIPFNASILSVGNLRKVEKHLEAQNAIQNNASSASSLNEESPKYRKRGYESEKDNETSLSFDDGSTSGGSAIKIRKKSAGIMASAKVLKKSRQFKNKSETPSAQRVVLRLQKEQSGTNNGYKVTDMSTVIKKDIIHQSVGNDPKQRSKPEFCTPKEPVTLLKQTLFTNDNRKNEGRLLDEFLTKLNCSGTRNDLTMLVNSKQTYCNTPVVSIDQAHNCVCAVTSVQALLKNKSGKNSPKKQKINKTCKASDKSESAASNLPQGDVNFSRGKRSVRLPARLRDPSIIATGTEWVSPDVSDDYEVYRNVRKPTPSSNEETSPIINLDNSSNILNACPKNDESSKTMRKSKVTKHGDPGKSIRGALFVGESKKMQGDVKKGSLEIMTRRSMSLTPVGLKLLPKEGCENQTSLTAGASFVDKSPSKKSLSKHNDLTKVAKNIRKNLTEKRNFESVTIEENLENHQNLPTFVQRKSTKSLSGVSKEVFTHSKSACDRKRKVLHSDRSDPKQDVSSNSGSPKAKCCIPAYKRLGNIPACVCENTSRALAYDGPTKRLRCRCMDKTSNYTRTVKIAPTVSAALKKSPEMAKTTLSNRINLHDYATTVNSEAITSVENRIFDSERDAEVSLDRIRNSCLSEINKRADSTFMKVPDLQSKKSSASEIINDSWTNSLVAKELGTTMKSGNVLPGNNKLVSFVIVPQPSNKAITTTASMSSVKKVISGKSNFIGSTNHQQLMMPTSTSSAKNTSLELNGQVIFKKVSSTFPSAQPVINRVFRRPQNLVSGGFSVNGSSVSIDSDAPSSTMVSTNVPPMVLQALSPDKPPHNENIHVNFKSIDGKRDHIYMKPSMRPDVGSAINQYSLASSTVSSTPAVAFQKMSKNAQPVRAIKVGDRFIFCSASSQNKNAVSESVLSSNFTHDASQVKSNGPTVVTIKPTQGTNTSVVSSLCSAFSSKHSSLIFAQSQKSDSPEILAHDQSISKRDELSSVQSQSTQFVPSKKIMEIDCAANIPDQAPSIEQNLNKKHNYSADSDIDIETVDPVESEQPLECLLRKNTCISDNLCNTDSLNNDDSSCSLSSDDMNNYDDEDDDEDDCNRSTDGDLLLSEEPGNIKGSDKKRVLEKNRRRQIKEHVNILRASHPAIRDKTRLRSVLDTATNVIQTCSAENFTLSLQVKVLLLKRTALLKKYRSQVLEMPEGLRKQEVCGMLQKLQDAVNLDESRQFPSSPSPYLARTSKIFIRHLISQGRNGISASTPQDVYKQVLTSMSNQRRHPQPVKITSDSTNILNPNIVSKMRMSLKKKFESPNESESSSASVPCNNDSQQAYEFLKCNERSMLYPENEEDVDNPMALSSRASIKGFQDKHPAVERNQNEILRGDSTLGIPSTSQSAEVSTKNAPSSSPVFSCLRSSKDVPDETVQKGWRQDALSPSSQISPRLQFLLTNNESELRQSNQNSSCSNRPLLPRPFELVSDNANHPIALLNQEHLSQKRLSSGDGVRSVSKWYSSFGISVDNSATAKDCNKTVDDGDLSDAVPLIIDKSISCSKENEPDLLS